MTNLAEAYAVYLPWVEAEMRSLLSSTRPDLFRHYGIMQYHMGWRDTDLAPVEAAGGKRIRPMLCLLACAAAGADPRAAVPAAAGIELLHNFSLIHDDIEDNGVTRRHRPTAWAAFGLPLACNAGDAMFTLAHMAFYRLAERGLSEGALCRALRAFDQACVELTEGQFLDLSFELRLDVTVEEYSAMIFGKTAALLGVAPEIGALVGGAEAPAAATFRRFGRAMGMAFQLQDDVLGIWGDEAVTGKSAASDILSKKKSLPVVYALADERVGPEMQARYAGPAFSSADVPAVLQLLDACGARAYTEARAADALAEARQALAAVSEGTSPRAEAPLRELLDSLLGRAA